MILDTMYGPGPDGLCGNDDAGQMSAWYVFSSLGFYPVCPGSTEYALGSPSVERATVHLENGRDLNVIVHDQSPQNVFVREVLLNGEPVEGRSLDHEDLANGGELEFFMGPDPDTGR